MSKGNHRTTQTDDAAKFNARFHRYRRLLRFVATRVLGGPERADEAVENCWRSAFRNPPRFEYDGAFSSWLVRILIDEALAIRRDYAGYEHRGASSLTGHRHV